METIIQSEFIFRSIGQGLFYTGKIKDFTFVYDCGTDSGGNFIKNAIKEFQNELTSIVNQSEVKKDLDLLVISHFDRDHINGLPELLEKFQVHTVVIPYLYPIERLKVASRNISESEEYYDLIKDPVAYFTKYKVKQIILITGEQSNQPNETNEPNHLNLDDDSSFDYDLIEDMDKLPNSPLDKDIRGIEDFASLPGDIKVRIKKRGTVNVGFKWEFSFFTYDRTPEIVKIFSEIEKINNKDLKIKDELIEVLTSKNRNRIKKHYLDIITRIKKEHPKINIDDSNNTSIVLSHMPIDTSWGLTESMLIRDKKETEVISKFKQLTNSKVRKNIRLNKTFRESKYFRWYSKNRKLGTLLFGDIDIRKDFNQIKNFFGEKLNNISVISIPHHGSANNWDIRLFSLINKSFDYFYYEPVMWIVSSGFGNKHGHPDSEIVNQIIQQYPEMVLFLSSELMKVYIKNTVVWDKM